MDRVAFGFAFASVPAESVDNATVERRIGGSRRRESASSIGSPTIAESDEIENRVAGVGLVADSLEIGAAATDDDRAYDSGGGDGDGGDDDGGRDEHDGGDDDGGDVVVVLVVPLSFDGR